MEEQEVWIPKCWVCMDEGLIQYWKEYAGGMRAAYVVKCMCPAVKEWYLGYPSVEQYLDPERLAMENFRDWYKKNKHKQGVKEKLERLGIRLPEDEGDESEKTEKEAG